MKKFSVVLLILALVASFAFAADPTQDFTKVEGGKTAVQKYGWVENKSWATVAPKDSVELNGKLGVNFNFDFDKKDCYFGKSASIAYFDLSASKTIFEGVGSVKGEGAVYAAADASISLALKNTAELANSKLDEDGNFGFYTKDGSSWKREEETVDYTLKSSFKLAINNFYIAKDGAWKLNLLKSDASLDYAQSSLTSKKSYHKDNNFQNENVKKAYATFKAGVNNWKGVTFTADADPYFGELAFGYENNTSWNVLAKSKAVALEDLTVEGGFVIGTAKDTHALEMGIGLNTAYADDYVALKAAADFGISGLDKDVDAKFDCDVYAQAKAFGATLDFYYATVANEYAPSDYYWTFTSSSDTATKLVGKKYMEAKVAYAINYADVDFEVGFVAKDLNWDSRNFGATFSAEHAIGTFGAEVDFTPAKKTVSADFDVTYVADYFDAYADFEFEKTKGKDFAYGINVGVETDKIVDACTFGLEFNYTSKAWTNGQVDDIDYGRWIKAFAKVAF